MHCTVSEKTGAWVLGSSVAGAAEEEAVLGHRVVDARAGERQAVDAAEGGDHDGRRHDLHGDRPEHAGRGGGGHAILVGVLDGFERSAR